MWQQEDQALQETPCCDIALQLGVKIHSSHLFISIVRILSSVNGLINSYGLAKIPNFFVLTGLEDRKYLFAILEVFFCKRVVRFHSEIQFYGSHGSNQGKIFCRVKPIGA